MRDKQRYFPVNWMDGMKINKSVFLAQDHANRDALQQASSLQLSPLRYGILPPDASGRDTFSLKISLDNQSTLRVTVLSCQAITSGGAFVSIPAFSDGRQTLSANTSTNNNSNNSAGYSTNTEKSSSPERNISLDKGLSTDGVPSLSFIFHPGAAEMNYWVVLTVNPFETIPGGSPDLEENPPRLPYALPLYTLQVVNDNDYKQYSRHPYALTIGKVSVQGNTVHIREEYIPPCYSVSAHPDLLAVYSELDNFLAGLEMRCSRIVQKIYKRNQQNELSELVLFVADRILLYIGQSITQLRWSLVHESPAHLFATVAGLARIMKNTIDLRIGTGKDELLNYLSEWCDLKQGELENMLASLAQFRYDHNDIMQCILSITSFIKVTGKLFETLSNLEFIGKRKEAGFFVKEEHVDLDGGLAQRTAPRRRFFG